MKFAVIGHQDCWQKILRFAESLHDEDSDHTLSLDKVKEVYSFFPPAKLFDINVMSPGSGLTTGIYIESFISPDELDNSHLRKNLNKVKAACEKVASLDVDVVSLGGFTSIILEMGGHHLSHIDNTAFTTGNTLTAAFIADSIQKAVAKWNKCLADCRLLIIGSTGDIGSACVNYFSGMVKEILLTARQPGPLKEQEDRLKKLGVDCKSSVETITLLPQADIVICVASALLPPHYLDVLPENTIVCDAGYPKNLQVDRNRDDLKIYAGGMGLVEGGYHFAPEHYRELIYDFPLPGISHGCILESIVLAMENNAVPYSCGRGNITRQRMNELLHSASRHGIVTSPFFNSSGLLQ